MKRAVCFVLLTGLLMAVLSGCGGTSRRSPTTSRAEATATPVPTPTPTRAPLDIEEMVPAGVPILVDEAGMLFSHTEGEVDYDEYDRLKEQFDAELDAALRDRVPKVCVVSPALDFVSAQGYDTLGERYGYPYFWLDSYGETPTIRNMWNGELMTYNYYLFTYTEDADQMDTMQAEIDAAVEDYLSRIPEDADAWQAAKIVHDELIRRVTYDEAENNVMHSHDIYGALVQNSAVCQGYAFAFSYVMREWTQRTGRELRAGVNYYPAILSEDHAWNTVGGATYDENMDVTWDDPDMVDANGNPYIFYSYFGLTTEEMQKVDEHEATGVNRNDDEYYLADPEPFNYYRHEGYYLTSYDIDAIANAFAAQMAAGSNLLTVKFENEEDFLRAKSWPEDNAQELYDIMARVGYSDGALFWSHDDVLTCSIGLYPPPEE